MNDYFFYFCASQKRLPDGTPLTRRRFATEEEARKTAEMWAKDSNRGGAYIVYECRAVGEAQRQEPSVLYRHLGASNSNTANLQQQQGASAFGITSPTWECESCGHLTSTAFIYCNHCSGRKFD